MSYFVGYHKGTGKSVVLYKGAVSHWHTHSCDWSKSCKFKKTLLMERKCASTGQFDRSVLWVKLFKEKADKKNKLI